MTGDLTAAASVAMIIHRELEDDYVGLWKIPWHLRRALPGATDEDLREIAEAVLEALLGAGVAIGRLDETTGSFEPWAAHNAVDNVMSGWRALGRDPNIGEVAWLARTSRPDSFSASCSPSSGGPSL